MPVGKVWLVGAGPGDPDLISVRGRELLRQAEVVLHDALSHPRLLEYCEHAEIIDVGKRFGERSPAQPLITSKLLEFARQGKRVVRLKGGDPYMFARGAEEALALAEAGIPFEVVPGVSSAAAAAAFAGFPLTHRDVSSSVTFITGSDREGQQWSPDAWRKLATATDTICIFMGMRRVEELTRAIVEGGRSPSTPAAVVQWGARPEQRVVMGTLGDIAERCRAAGVSNPAVIFIGEVVTLRSHLRFFDNQPLFGKRVLVPRAEQQATETLELLRQRGANPVTVPLIEIRDPSNVEPLRAVALHVSEFDWVVFTSANGVRRFFAILKQLGRDARAFAGAKVAVVGPKTARALESFGIAPDLVAQEHTATGLAAEMLAAGGEAGSAAKLGRVLFVRAMVGNDALPERLKQAGAVLELVAAYETHSLAPANAPALLGLLEQGELDAILFTSSSTVTYLAEALGDKLGLLSQVRVASIGPLTTATLDALGIRIDVRTEEHTVEALVNALEQSYRNG